jgi:predicted  nucleic acid-binding Zn-ribbon protein
VTTLHAESFRPVFEAMKETAVALVEASEANALASAATARAGEGLKKMAAAALHAQDEHEDLRETVARLEGLVIAEGQDIRAMRERLDRGST